MNAPRKQLCLIPFLVGSFAGTAWCQFGPQELISNALGRPSHMLAADLDGDGVDDVVLSARPSSSVFVDRLTWFRALPSGLLSPPNTIAVLGGPVHMRALDVDEDGDLDLVVASTDTDRLRWLPNDGTGMFGAAQIIDSGVSGVTTLSLADIDGDGRTDLLTATSQTQELAWYRNLGGGSFGSAQAIGGSLTSVYKPVAGDLDGDGDADVLVIRFGTGAGVIRFENLGAAGFGPEQLFFSAATIRKILIRDINRDGDLDVVLLDFSSGHVFRNNGAGVFTQTAGGVSGGSDLDLTDANGDGNLDAFWCRYGSNENYGWSEGGRLHGFPGGSVLHSATDSAQLVLPIDLDRDGDPEFLIATGTISSNSIVDDRLYLHRNLHTQGVTYCAAEPNSSGASGQLEGTGSRAVDAGQLVITASRLPAGESGYFLSSLDTDFVPLVGGSSGNLCLGGAIGRWVDQVGAISSSGKLQLRPNWSKVPTPSGTVAAMAGQTWYFQCWYRDQGIGPTSNFTEGLALDLR